MCPGPRPSRSCCIKFQAGRRPPSRSIPWKAYVKTFPPAAVARDQLTHATAELSTHEAGRVRKYLDDAIQAALTGQLSAKEALTDAQKQAKSILRRY